MIQTTPIACLYLKAELKVDYIKEILNEDSAIKCSQSHLKPWHPNNLWCVSFPSSNNTNRAFHSFYIAFIIKFKRKVYSHCWPCENWIWQLLIFFGQYVSLNWRFSHPCHIYQLELTKPNILNMQFFPVTMTPSCLFMIMSLASTLNLFMHIFVILLQEEAYTN